ncbi:hypothetical protein [Silvimonas sp.]|uniref:hypothetical protein n=1 Tax=Silvimonas sp. TaxID=2650811 RepID=UPI00284512F9|nr:hypothetical protein [Silvimonas sp.]MDR3427738.1 hypothetical protein [Silvimonas sp.]
MATKEEADERVSFLANELGDASQYSFLIPGWEPVDSIMGFRWMRSTLWEGFYVAYQIDDVARVVRFKSWEFGDLEPEWNSIKYEA